MPGPSIIWYLKRMELFDDMDEDELLELGSHLKHGRVQKGDPIYLPGQPSNTIYFPKEGRIKLSRLTGEGRPITLDILEPGDIFGEIAHTEHLRGDTVAEAMEDSFLCEMRRDTFLMLLKSKPEFALRVVELMDGRRQRFEFAWMNSYTRMWRPGWRGYSCACRISMAPWVPRGSASAWD